MLALHRALYLDHRAAVMPPELEILYAYRGFEQVLAEDVSAMLRNASTTILLAEDAEAIVGYVSGYVTSAPRRVLSRKGILGDWYVRESHRGTGVGRQLTEALMDVFREAGCTVVETSTWPFNHGARAAMGKLGFEEIQIVYRKHLEEPEP